MRGIHIAPREMLNEDHLSYLHNEGYEFLCKQARDPANDVTKNKLNGDLLKPLYLMGYDAVARNGCWQRGDEWRVSDGKYAWRGTNYTT